MSEEGRAQVALATLLIVIFGGAALIAVAAPLLPADHHLVVAFFAALPIAAIRCAIAELEDNDD